MARIYAPLVRQASTTTGTGAYTVSGTVTGHEQFSARCSVADVFRYVAREVDGGGNPTGAYEVGTGTYSSANTITRTAVLYSSNSDAAVSWTAGTRYIDIISWVDEILGQNVTSLDPVTVTDTKALPIDADTLLMFDSAASGNPVIVTKAQLLAIVTAAIVALDDRVTTLEGASPVAPSAFTVGQWTVTATGSTGAVSIDLTALPSNGGSAITALQYRVGAGAAVTLSGTGTGARTVTGLTDDVAVDIQVRAVNAIGDGAWSDTKSVTPTAAATAPAAFTVGQWTLTAGDTLLAANLTALPSDGGSTITALEYRLDGGTAVAFVGTGTGSRNITGLTNATAYDVEIRAVNAIGAGAWSDLKSATPAAASGPVYIGSTVASAFTTVVGTLPSGVTASDTLVAILGTFSGTAPATAVAPSGWTAFDGNVGTGGSGSARYFTAPGDVGTLTFASTGFLTLVLVGVSAPLRTAAFTALDYAGPGATGANRPTPTVTATAGDCVVSVYLQMDDGSVPLLVDPGTPQSGYTRERFDNTAAPYLSILSLEGASAGATGDISHDANGNFSARAVFTGSFGP